MSGSAAAAPAAPAAASADGPAVLAIDIGTSGTRLSAFDADGALLITRSVSYAVEAPAPGWAEQDPAAWWNAVCALGPQVMTALDGRPLAAVCVSGQAPSCVAIDRAGDVLRPAILWLDRRASSEAAWFAAELGEARCERVGGNRLDGYFGGLKWRWFRAHEPGLFARTWKILQANGYVSWRLTGVVATDASQAGLCSPAFDLEAGTWDEALCRDMGIPAELLPEIRPAASVIGLIRHDAADATGLPAGTPVVCGAGDFACAALGAGVVAPGTAALMLGTAGNLLLPGSTSRDTRLMHTRHVHGERLVLGGVLAGGNLGWLASLFGGSSEALFARANAAAAEVAPGADGLLYLPYLAGERSPVWDPEARGAYVGLTLAHGQAHLYRAMLEGIGFAFRQVAEIAGVLGAQGAVALGGIVAIDGGARSALWRSILASVLGVPVRWGTDRAGTGLGAGYLAALGAGLVDGFAGIGAWVSPADEVLPDPAAAERYDRLYPVYAGLYPALREGLHATDR